MPFVKDYPDIIYTLGEPEEFSMPNWISNDYLMPGRIPCGPITYVCTTTP